MRRTIRPIRRHPDDVTLITGGAGFIGTNVAANRLADGRRVRVFDNLSRAGVETNLRWLCDTYGDRVETVTADVRDRAALKAALVGAGEVFHFAAQVAVTSSLEDPRFDFDVNAGGTLNLLEELRALSSPPPTVFTSTNKVYGDLDDVELVPEGDRYVPLDPAIRRTGISERRGVDFHSPYGCSKGAADQYVLDYARTFGIPAVVFRMSCIYGPHQFGTEDQGWIAHFVSQAIDRQPIVIYGDGLQVRDVLFVEDLVRAFLLAQSNIDRIAGEVFNIGGGPDRTVSLVELLAMIERIEARSVAVDYDGWREADQRYYVSDITKFGQATGWRPTVSVEDGVAALHAWLVGQATTARLAQSLAS